jgi:membrane peptidoglycan carboxypeptidase
VLPENVARTETYMLKTVITNGTASGSANIGRPAAGKTGTTDLKADAWFVGYTPQYTAAVWMGDPSGDTPMTNVGGQTVWGGTYPAQIWASLMKAAVATLPAIDFPEPDRSQWPTPQFVDEKGRRFSNRGVSRVPTTDPPVTSPNTPAPTTPTTVSNTTVPSTAAPTTVPAPTTTSP